MKRLKDMYLTEIRSKKFDAALVSMPCSMYSGGRTGDGGPAPLRGSVGKDIYGLPGLSIKDKEKVRAGTILALRGADLAKECSVQDIPWLAETPKFSEDSPSLLRLPEWANIYGRSDVNKKTHTPMHAWRTYHEAHGNLGHYTYRRPTR